MGNSLSTYGAPLLPGVGCNAVLVTSRSRLLADEGVCRLEAAGEFDAEHPAEAAHLLGRQRMLRVGGQAGKVHPGHRRMFVQRFGERPAVGVVPGQPQRQGAQAAQQQPRVETGRAPRR